LSFQVSRLDADDKERPDVVAMRPMAKCGGCGALIYADAVTGQRERMETQPN
jgi:hypothetical protein